MNLALVCIPLVLSAFTHLFNSTGFPCVSFDESIYVRRSLHILEGLGPQDPSSRFDHGQETNSSYDHPHFGQIFLAGIFQIIGYPSSLHTLPTVESIEMLYTVPRILMGILAVVDTFLLYKIVERRYNRNVALVSSILFAVMPLGWLNRWILLDNILLPFLLLSILFALYVKRNNNNNNNNNNNLDSSAKDTQDSINSRNSNDSKKIILTILSGIFLGLAIYTKITAFTMIPLVGFLIFTNNKSFKSLALWLVPVILIPSLWPLYALSAGQFNEWIDGVIWQGLERPSTGVLGQLTTVLNMDPVLVILSIIGVIYVTVRRDYLVLVWIAPFLIFAISIHWIYPFHFILLLPAACIASALLIVEVPKRILKEAKHQKLLTITIISGIGIFGLISLTTFFNTNYLLTQIMHASLAIKNIQFAENSKKDITIISAPEYSWIFKYIFNEEYAFQTREASIKTDKILLMVDRSYFSVVSRDPLKPEIENEQQIKLLMNIYNNTNPKMSIMNDEIPPNLQKYPYTNIKNCSFKNLQIRTNY